MTFRKAVLSLAVLLVASALSALAQGTYTEIDYPGAIDTYFEGINDIGDVVGSYIDSANHTHGFLLSEAGTYTTIDYPGESDTYAWGVNDVGSVVGSATIPTDIGFVYEAQSQTFTVLTLPPKGTTTFPRGINGSGEIVGFAYTTYAAHGFESFGSTHREIMPPHTHDSGAFGISADGVIVGTVTNIHGDTSNFEFTRGTYQRIAISGASGVVAYGINPAGTAIVGSYLPSTNVAYGFVYEGNVLTTLQFPGAESTFAMGINSSGQAVGYFGDSMNNLHGFTWTPDADAGKK